MDVISILSFHLPSSRAIIFLYQDGLRAVGIEVNKIPQFETQQLENSIDKWIRTKPTNLHTIKICTFVIAVCSTQHPTHRSPANPYVYVYVIDQVKQSFNLRLPRFSTRSPPISDRKVSSLRTADRTNRKGSATGRSCFICSDRCPDVG